MQRLKRHGTRIVLGLGLVALAMVAQVVPTFAANVGVTYAGGSLSGGTITYGDFGGITLNGARQTTTAIWSIADITDARGTGNGWNLGLTLPALAEFNTGTGAYVSGGKTLPTSSVTVTTAPTIAQIDQTSSLTNTVTPVATGTALDTGSPVKLLSASLNGGMGGFTFGQMTITLATAATTYARTYKTDATISLNDAP